MSDAGALTIGSGALRQLHQSLLRDAPDSAVNILQETGYAAGAGVYDAFRAWLPGATGVAEPQELDSARLSDVLSQFFQSQGWGSVTIERLGAAALTMDSSDWAEAEPGSAQSPMCYFSSGMLAALLGLLSGETVAVMEVECRSRGDGRCRFLSASPETLNVVYEQLTQGRSYAEALGA